MYKCDHFISKITLSNFIPVIHHEKKMSYKRFESHLVEVLGWLVVSFEFENPSAPSQMALGFESSVTQFFYGEIQDYSCNSPYKN